MISLKTINSGIQIPVSGFDSGSIELEYNNILELIEVLEFFFEHLNKIRKDDTIELDKIFHSPFFRWTDFIGVERTAKNISIKSFFFFDPEIYEGFLMLDFPKIQDSNNPLFCRENQSIIINQNSVLELAQSIKRIAELGRKAI